VIGGSGQDIGSGRAVRPGPPNREDDRLDRKRARDGWRPYCQVNRLVQSESTDPTPNHQSPITNHQLLITVDCSLITLPAADILAANRKEPAMALRGTRRKHE
jgi:hypothetical protein